MSLFDELKWKHRNVEIISLAKDTLQWRPISAKYRKFEVQVWGINEPSSHPRAFPEYCNVFVYPTECANRLL